MRRMAFAAAVAAVVTMTSEMSAQQRGTLNLNGVENQKDGFLTRGILVDIPLLRKEAYLQPGTPIYPADLEAWEKVFHASVLPWLKQRGVALLGNDAVNDVQPSGVADSPRPIHQVAIVAMGLPLVDVMDLEAVAKEAARLGRWEFLLTVAPGPVLGGTRFPINPIATF